MIGGQNVKLEDICEEAAEGAQREKITNFDIYLVILY
jgi:hypothetical protein